MLHVFLAALSIYCLACLDFFLSRTKPGVLRVCCLAKFALCLAAAPLLEGEIFFRISPIFDTFDCIPGLKHFWPDWLYFKPNSFSHRDREFTLRKPEGTFRILIAGDSFTEGAGVTRAQTYPRQLEDNLNASPGFTGRKVEVLKLGHCGMNTKDEADLPLRQAPRLDPDMIVLAYVHNDPEYKGSPFVSALAGQQLAQAGQAASDASAAPA